MIALAAEVMYYKRTPSKVTDITAKMALKLDKDHVSRINVTPVYWRGVGRRPVIFTIFLFLFLCNIEDLGVVFLFLKVCIYVVVFIRSVCFLFCDDGYYDLLLMFLLYD